MGRTERTREKLIAASLTLFDERGYDATTVAAIAERAGVTEMTFFRHFPTKHSVLVDDPYDPLIAAAVRSRPIAEGALVAVVRGIRDAWHSVPAPAADAVRERLRIIANTPGLEGALDRGSHATVEAIATALIDRGVEPPVARVAAAATVSGLNAALLEWARGDDPDLGAALELAFRALGDA